MFKNKPFQGCIVSKPFLGSKNQMIASTSNMHDTHVPCGDLKKCQNTKIETPTFFQTESPIYKVLLPTVIDLIVLPNQTYIGSLQRLEKQTLDTQAFIELIPHPPSQTLGYHIHHASLCKLRLTSPCPMTAPVVPQEKKVRQGLNPRLTSPDPNNAHAVPQQSHCSSEPGFGFHIIQLKESNARSAK